MARRYVLLASIYIEISTRTETKKETNIQHSMATNKLITAAIILILIVLIVLVIWSKLF